MKTSDYRIGNYVHAKSPEKEIYESPVVLGDYYFKCLIDGTIDIKPIELTEEILLKLGFKKEKGMYINNYYMFLNGIWNIKFKRNGYCSFITFGCFLTHIQYVHELQNLYFALTKEELTF